MQCLAPKPTAGCQRYRLCAFKMAQSVSQGTVTSGQRRATNCKLSRLAGEGWLGSQFRVVGLWFGVKRQPHTSPNVATPNRSRRGAARHFGAPRSEPGSTLIASRQRS